MGNTILLLADDLDYRGHYRNKKRDEVTSYNCCIFVYAYIIIYGLFGIRTISCSNGLCLIMINHVYTNKRLS